MKVVFRVDASLQMGTGHVMRCLTLAQALKENGADVKFISRKHEGSLIDKIRSSGFVVHELGVSEEIKVDARLAHSHWLGATQQQDADDCIDIFNAKKIDLLIVDHYSLDEQWQKRLKPYYEKLMVIDDLADRKHQCNILLDQTFGRKKEDYLKLVPKDCELLLGSQYALLRPEFYKWRPYSLERRGKPEFKQLLISMGGVDPYNITEQVLDELNNNYLPSDIEITVVMGSKSPHIESVKRKAKILNYHVFVLVNIDNMAELMSNSDLVICAASSIALEGCCLGLPLLLKPWAENQRKSAANLENKRIVKLFYDNLSFGKALIEASQELAELSFRSRVVCDGSGLNIVMRGIYGQEYKRRKIEFLE